MSAAGPTIFPIFATPFVVVPLPEAAPLNGELKSLFLGRATDAWRDPTPPFDALCFESREEVFEWQIGPAEHLKQVLLAGLCAAVMEASGSSEAEFDTLRMQTRARFTIVRPHGCVPASSAPMASWYALYCVAAPPVPPERADSGALRLYAVRDGTMFLDASNWRLPGQFGRFHHNWRPIPGQMAVFPASIVHEVAVNRGAGELVLVKIRARFAHPGQVALPPW